MALADTAALVASLELKDKFSKNVDKFNASVGGMEQRVSTFGRIGNQVSSGLGTAAHNLQNIALVGVGVIGAAVAGGIRSLEELENVTAATNAVIKSTGGTAGITAKQVRDLAEQFEGLNATMDDKVIQSAENVLLTFTSIGKDAFPQALEAALNLNQALGGGPEGLQGTIIQVGKALQDPIRGITALRRVGVNFTKAQEAQIKALVEANDLYGAQQLILKELATEFGGQFAAAGTTATAKFAKLKDTIEDSQMALATAFLPVLVKVSDKLTTFLSDPATIAGIQEFGGTLADAFDSIVELAGNLPWDSIANAFEIMGTGSKALLEAFTSLPPWVQTAVLTGWGLNKLTGGALTGIAGALASGLIKGVLGINAGVVNINAGTVTGGGGGTVVGGGGGAGSVIKSIFGIGAFVAIGTAIGEVVAQNITRPLNQIQFDFNAVAGASGRFGSVAQANEFAQGLADRLGIPLDEVQSKIVVAVQSQGLSFDAAVRRLDGSMSRRESGSRSAAFRDAQQTQQQIQNLKDATLNNGQHLMEISGEARQQIQEAAQARAIAANQLQVQAQSLMSLQRIEGKNFSPIVKVAVTSSVSISEIQRRITSQQIAIGVGPQEF
jgi:hypothetical protein